MTVMIYESRYEYARTDIYGEVIETGKLDDLRSRVGPDERLKMRAVYVFDLPE